MIFFEKSSYNKLSPLKGLIFIGASHDSEIAFDDDCRFGFRLYVYNQHERVFDIV